MSLPRPFLRYSSSRSTTLKLSSFVTSPFPRLVTCCDESGCISSICFWFYGKKCLSQPYVLHIQKTINNNPCGGVTLLGSVCRFSFLCGSWTDQAECSSGGHWGGVWFWSITLWLRRGKELAINIVDGGSGCCWSHLRTLCVHRRNT